MTEMEGAVQPQPAFATVGANYRRTILTAVAVGAAGLVGLTLDHQYAAGLLLCVGLGLGAYNSGMVARAAARYAVEAPEGTAPPRGRIVSGVFARLLAITAVALVLLFAVRPGGWGAVAGLAVFQLLLVGNSLAPMIKEVRRT
ncbi:MAG: hypothetical protein ACYCO3_11615 [Mycobacteriales bacterium]